MYPLSTWRDKNMNELERLTQEIIVEYRGYFDLLRSYKPGNHEKIMTQLDQVRELERKLKNVAGDDKAASQLFHQCYQTVLDENPWARTDFWSDR